MKVQVISCKGIPVEVVGSLAEVTTFYSHFREWHEFNASGSYAPSFFYCEAIKIGTEIADLSVTELYLEHTCAGVY